MTKAYKVQLSSFTAKMSFISTNGANLMDSKSFYHAFREERTIPFCLDKCLSLFKNLARKMLVIL